jgi:methylated-DNA-[protein]-cysteine S-methyltransferase
VRIAYHMMSSPVGLLFLARGERGLRYLEFVDRKSLKRIIASHADSSPEATWEPSLLELKDVVDALDAYFNGMLHEFELPLDPVGTDFQRKVWNALSEIPFGQTRTYGQIAKSIRQPKATRAVGLANNQNPISIIVPCHRVIGANGSLTGYGGGMHRKRWLLDHEARFAGEGATVQELFVGSGNKPRR